MKKEIKEKWLAALRSGEYQKGQNQLRRTVGENKYTYCCLGVLCDIHSKETGKGSYNEYNVYTVYTVTGEIAGERDWLPKEVAEWAGIESTHGGFSPPPGDGDDLLKAIKGGYGSVTLARINDIKEGYHYHNPTFNTVAGYIEKYF
jgi:hypothetical protein